MFSSHGWVLEEFCNEYNPYPCSLNSSISRLMWRGSSVNSWPDILKGFTFQKLLCFLIFNNIVCQSFTFYPTWSPIRKCWQAPSETRTSTATFRSWESFHWLQQTVEQILKQCQNLVFLWISQGYKCFRSLFRQHATHWCVRWLVTTSLLWLHLQGWCLYIGPIHTSQERFHGSELR